MKIDQCVVLREKLGSELSSNVVKSWQSYYQRGTYMDGVSSFPSAERCGFASDVDSALNFYKTKDLDYLLLNWFGVFFSDIRKFQSRAEEFVDSLPTEDWLYCGHLIDKEKQFKDEAYKGIFYAYPIVVLINLQTWRRLGYPSWEAPIDEKHLVQRSDENIHDDYTPLRLNPSGESEPASFSPEGQSFLNASLNAGLSVNNIPERLRDCYFHTYPEEEAETFERTFQTLFQAPIFKERNLLRISERLLQNRSLQMSTGWEGEFFWFNTEELIPQGFESVAERALDQCQMLLTPCSLLKSFLLGLKSPQLETLIHFDIFEKNLEAKEYFTEQWTGSFQSFLEIYNELVPSADRSPSDQKRLDGQWQDLLETFGSEPQLVSAWAHHKSLRHEFIEANLLLDDSRLIRKAAKLGKDKSAYLAMGDIPGYLFNTLSFGVDFLEDHTSRHIRDLGSVLNELYIDVKLPFSDKHIVGSQLEVLQRIKTDKDAEHFSVYSSSI